MQQNSQRTYAYFDTDDSLDEQTPRDPAMAGLPETWRHYGWRVAAVFFATLWLLESLASGGLLNGVMSLSPTAEGVLALVVVLAVCFGLFHFLSRRRPKIGSSRAS